VVTRGSVKTQAGPRRPVGEADPVDKPGTGSLHKGGKPNVFSMRGTKEWREWLTRFATHHRMTPTTLVDYALTQAARRAGFEEPPPRA